MSSSSIVKYTIVGIALLMLAILTPQMVETVDAGEVMVIQYPMGELEAITEQGPKAQWFGKVTKYPLRKQYEFCSTIDATNGAEYRCPGADADGKRVRFSEGGHGVINGAVSWEMPMDKGHILAAHRKFGSPEGIESAAVSKMLDSAIYFAGPMMSSTESSGARRGELVQYINDQAMHGIYVTQSKQETIKDAAGGDQTVTITEIVRDKKTNQPMRQQGSILEEFHIALMPISINRLDYDKVVEKQIADRQAATTQVQLSIAKAVEAEQTAKTVEAQGKAAAAQAKWDQETIKAKAVTLAQQQLEVATLGAKTAEQYKREQILRGEGDAAKARLVMQANGALEQKLETYKVVNNRYAEAIEKHQGPLVPATIIGNSGTSGSNASVQGLIDMLQVKTARDIGLDMSMKK